VFFDDIPQLKEHPALVQKSDGAFNYTTTDLATIRYRVERWNPDQILYVVDHRQGGQLRPPAPPSLGARRIHSQNISVASAIQTRLSANSMSSPDFTPSAFVKGKGAWGR